MVLSRSNSGPGSLSINTSSANSLFGSNNPTNQTPAPASGSLFGAAAKPATSLFGSASSTQAQPNGSLFGSATNTATTSQTAPSIFGVSNMSAPVMSGGLAPTASRPATNMFGAPTASSQPSGGLFGAAISQPSGAPFGAAASQPSGGLFGTAATTAQQSGGLFGSSTANPQPSQPSMFGSTPSAQPSKPLFGSSLQPPAQPQPSTSLFGATLQPPQPSQQPQGPSLFGQSSFSGTQPSLVNPMSNPSISTTGPLQNQVPSLRYGGGPTRTPAPNTSVISVPAVRIDASNMRSTTRFSELTPEAAHIIKSIQRLVDQNIAYSNAATSSLPIIEPRVGSIEGDVTYLQRRSDITRLAHENDTLAIERAKVALQQDEADFRLSAVALSRMTLPQGYNDRLEDTAGDSRQVVDLFTTRANAMAETLAAYNARLMQVEGHVRGVEASLGAALLGRRGEVGSGEAVRQVGLALRDFESGILGVAGKVGEVRETVQALELGRAP
ncbi:MAG: hypothetical protein M1814_003421 [Vezdaea aestivalis]|nr:MAG: hypothetical protein M1814_003421 [Vezdaea aestivalis]